MGCGRRTRRKRKTPRRHKGQKGGIFPLLALLPAAAAIGKAAALGAVGAGVGVGVQKLAGK